LRAAVVGRAAYADGTAREATEIQNLQVGDGDVVRGLAIPLYMIFPRIFTCPTSISDVSCQAAAAGVGVGVGEWRSYAP